MNEIEFGLEILLRLKIEKFLELIIEKKFKFE